MTTLHSKTWRKVKLVEVVDVFGGGTPSTRIPNYWNGDIPWLTPAEITNRHDRFIDMTLRYITSDGLRNSSATLMDPESILLTSRATVGEAVINTVPMTTNQGFINIRPKSVDKMFIFYWLKWRKNYLNQMAIGSTFPEISKSVFKQIEIELPIDVTDQKRIAEVLSAFDDKIELNNKISRTLEQMAQAIFKEWFVKNESEQLPLTDLANFVNGGAFGKIVNNRKRGLPLIKIAEMNRGLSNNTEWVDKIVSEKYLIDSGDLLFSWSGTIGLNIWDKGKAILNQHLFKVVPKNGFTHGLIYLVLKARLPIFQQIAGSKATTMGHIQKHHLEEQLVTIPSRRNTQIFDNIYKKIVRLRLENQKLAALRDLLLPKLMSGAVRLI